METRYQIETQRVGKQLPLPPSSTSMVTVVRCAVWSGLPSSETFSSQWVGGPLHCGRRGGQSDALMKSCSSSVPLTGRAWSPTRPGVFFITKRNGNIDVWDLMDRSHEPSLAQNISSMAITSIHPCMAANIQQLMLAVGDSGGTLHILEVPWSLSHPSASKVTIMEAFFDRETKRLEFTAERTALRANEKKALDSAQIERENWRTTLLKIQKTGKNRQRRTMRSTWVWRKLC